MEAACQHSIDDAGIKANPHLKLNSSCVAEYRQVQTLLACIGRARQDMSHRHIAQVLKSVQSSCYDCTEIFCMPAGSSAPSGHSGSAFTGMPALGSLPTHSIDVTKSASGEPSLFTGQVQLLALRSLCCVALLHLMYCLSALKFNVKLCHASWMGELFTA